jgi:hypothetical protein
VIIRAMGRKAVMGLFRKDVFKVPSPVRDYNLFGCHVVDVLHCLREALTRRHTIPRGISLGV